jgi:hypothetical protein
MRWPALWPSGTDLTAACTRFSAQPKAGQQRVVPPSRRCAAAASANATGQVGAGRRPPAAAGGSSAALAQPVGQRAAHLLDLLAHLEVSRVPSTQALSAASAVGVGAARRASRWPAAAGRRAPGQVQLVEQPAAWRWLRR